MLQKIIQSKWFLRLLAVLAFVLFVRLGFWQIHRGELKSSLQKAQTLAALQKPDLLQANETPLPFQNIIVQGQYDDHLIFLDNQHWQHQFGYHVLSPFMTDSGQTILVNRGWVPGDPSRRILPTVKIPKGKQRISGQIWYPPLRNWNIGPQLEIKSNKVAILEQADTVLLEKFLGKKPTAYLLRMSASNPDGFIRIWPETSMSPQRHYGYALQWFAMALTVLILTIILSWRRKNETT